MLTPLAKRICARCPVRGQGLEYALSGADSWGGIATGIWSAPHHKSATGCSSGKPWRHDQRGQAQEKKAARDGSAASPQFV